jgi:hypothetical protein
VVQVAPTGFSAFIDEKGTIDQRTDIGAMAVGVRPVTLRSGSTWYVKLGDRPFIVLFALVLALAMWSSRQTYRRPPDPGAASRPSPVSVDLDDHRDRAVVDQVHRHLGAEPTRGQVGPELA